MHTRSQTAASRQQQIEASEVEDTAVSVRKRPRSDSADDLMARKKIALRPVVSDEDEVMADVEALPTAMDCPLPCTKKRKAVRKGKRQDRTAWR